jgi:hypothetical protein
MPGCLPLCPALPERDCVGVEQIQNCNQFNAFKKPPDTTDRQAAGPDQNNCQTLKRNFLLLLALPANSENRISMLEKLL